MAYGCRIPFSPARQRLGYPQGGEVLQRTAGSLQHRQKMEGGGGPPGISDPELGPCSDPRHLWRCLLLLQPLDLGRNSLGPFFQRTEGWQCLAFEPPNRTPQPSSRMIYSKKKTKLSGCLQWGLAIWVCVENSSGC